MSFDLRFYRADKLKEPLKKDAFEDLKDEFTIYFYQLDDQSNVLSFGARFKDDKPEWIEEKGFAFTYQNEKGYYSASLSYSFYDQGIEYFNRLTTQLSIRLGFDIFDPQLGM